ncbi:hypothetical protein C2E23DRAFT_24763 [Lenzites betulinus]|nr:hypothetical protein C2E23DRAFT_24763 [Lenzites betulinus]
MLLIDTRRRAWHSLSCCGTQIGPFTRPFMVYYFRLWVAPYPRQRTGTRPRIKSYAISPRRCEFPAYCDHQKSRARQFPVSTRRPLYLWPWTRRSQGEYSAAELTSSSRLIEVLHIRPGPRIPGSPGTAGDVKKYLLRTSARVMDAVPFQISITARLALASPNTPTAALTDARLYLSTRRGAGLYHQFMCPHVERAYQADFCHRDRATSRRVLYLHGEPVMLLTRTRREKDRTSACVPL